jgi:histidine ammonia-lyase
MTLSVAKSAAPLTDVPSVLAASGSGARLELSARERHRLAESRTLLAELAETTPVYGVSTGFGPLVEFPASEDPYQQATGLLDHLTAGQGDALGPDVTRTLMWLRLHGMRQGYSGVCPELWSVLAAQWNAGFTPTVPREGSLSASGDLIPLAHAAQAAAGRGQALVRRDGEWRPEPSAGVLQKLGVPAVTWDARSALAFVNGTTASLAVALHCHRDLTMLVRAVAESTGRLAALLGASLDPYDDHLAVVRGHPGHRTAATWIRAAAGPRPRRDPGRPLQEPYSLRCAPQVLGAALDQLRLQGEVLVTEAAGCTDNPVLCDGRAWHGGNFHAVPVALAVEQLTLVSHQVAFLAERQLALVLEPARNGGLPPFLTPVPGRGSGLAGVQMAATSELAAIRQHAFPASLTALPSNLGNQDHVPMALNGANALSGSLDRAWRITAALYLAVNQFCHLTVRDGAGDVPGAPLWGLLRERFAPLAADRPLAGDVRAVAGLIRERFDETETRCDRQ